MPYNADSNTERFGCSPYINCSTGDFGVELDYRVAAILKQLEQVQSAVIQLSQLSQSYYSQTQHKDERIAELECQVDPYSTDGGAICNSSF